MTCISQRGDCAPRFFSSESKVGLMRSRGSTKSAAPNSTATLGIPKTTGEANRHMLNYNDGRGQIGVDAIHIGQQQIQKHQVILVLCQ